jgi:hypothetical protein
MKIMFLAIPILAVALSGCDRSTSKANSLYSDAPGIQATPAKELTTEYENPKRTQDGESHPVK